MLVAKDIKFLLMSGSDTGGVSVSPQSPVIIIIIIIIIIMAKMKWTRYARPQAHQSGSIIRFM